MNDLPPKVIHQKLKTIMELIYKPTEVRHRAYCNVCHIEVPTLQKQSHRGTLQHLKNLYELGKFDINKYYNKIIFNLCSAQTL